MSVRAQLRDLPYRFVRRISATEIELAYGDNHERWRDERCRNIGTDILVVLFQGKAYRFVQVIKAQEGHRLPPRNKNR